MLQNKILGAIGPKGSGKTYAVSRYVASLPRVAVFRIDTRDVAYLHGSDHIIEGMPKLFANQLREEKFHLIYQPILVERDGDEVRFPEFEWFVEACYTAENLCMVVDEAHMLCTARTCPPALFEAVALGRRRGLDIIYCTQRFAMVSRALTANTDEFWLWKIIEPADLQGIRDRCGAEVAERVANLRRLSYEGNKIVPGERLQWSATEGVVSA